MSEQDYFNKDYYKVLGVKKDASADEIKKAYHSLARKYHPHRNKDNKSAEQKFKEINEANQVLSNSKERQKYDSIRQMAGGGARFNAGSGGGFEDLFGGFGGGNTHFSTSQGGSPFGSGGGFEDILGGLFGGARSQNSPFGSQFGGGQGQYGAQNGMHDPRYAQSPQTSAEPPKPKVDKVYTISYKIALFGGTLVHTTKNGEKVKFKVKPGTSSGKEVIVKPKEGSKERVKLNIKIPDISVLDEKTTLKAKSLLDEFEALLKSKS